MNVAKTDFLLGAIMLASLAVFHVTPESSMLGDVVAMPPIVGESHRRARQKVRALNK